MEKIRTYSKYLFVEKPVLGYGLLGVILWVAVHFLIGLIVFSIGLYITFRRQDKALAAQGGTKKCTQCQTDIPLLAKKCPQCQSKLKTPLSAAGKTLAFLIVVALISSMVMASMTDVPPPPVATEETEFNEDAAFCGMVGQYLAIVNGDQVTVTDDMVIAGLRIIAEKAAGTRFETTANRALEQGLASDAQGLIASLHELARSCGLR